MYIMYVSYTHAGGEKRESKSPKLAMFGDISLKWGVFCFIYFTGEVNEKKNILKDLRWEDDVL